MVRRRACLAMLGSALAPGLAGCQAGDPESTAPDTGGASASPTATFRYTTVGGGDLSVEPGAVKAPDLHWTVETIEPATRAHPCRLRIALENRGEARSLTVAGDLPFPTSPGSAVEGRVETRPVVMPVDADYERQFDGTCWQAALDDPDLADDAPWDWWGHTGEQTVELESGKRIDGTYHVLASWVASCIPRGTYRFDRRYELAGTAYEWSFTLEVPSYDRFP